MPGNDKVLTDAMDSTGLKKVHSFGVLEKFGYEERWTIQGLQVKTHDWDYCYIYMDRHVVNIVDLVLVIIMNVLNIMS